MKTISVMVNGELAERAAPVLRRYGFDLETALNAYLMQIATDIAALSHKQEQAEYVRPPFQFGSLKGILNIDDDFSDVLADFSGYM
ncbi:MAG: hypothetical protein LBC28_01410 [Oscillospiraceae bacterium]|jgi:hypothetical protein|nr:hypothetical protein [Oscillospiraceae bacterium]